MKLLNFARLTGGLCLGCALAATTPSWASSPENTVPLAPMVLQQVLAVDDATLETLRGGFEWGQGLRVSFGVVRTVAINGETVHSTRFQVPNIGPQSTERLQLPSHIVQNGSNNVALLSEGVQAATTIVQNSLSNQHISTLTEINTVVNSLSLIQSLNARTTMQEALLGGLAVR